VIVIGQIHPSKLSQIWINHLRHAHLWIGTDKAAHEVNVSDEKARVAPGPLKFLESKYD
jgi:hypothetical protein